MLADEHDRQRDYTLRLGEACLKREDRAAWFDGLNLTNETDGTTIICGPVADQSALHGLLQKVRDLGLPLVSVTQVQPDYSEYPTIEPR